MEGGMVAFIAKGLADWTGDPGETSALPAGVRWRLDMAKAGLEVIAFGREGIDGAGGETGFALAVIAGACGFRPCKVRQVIQEKSGAEGMPEAKDGVNGEAKRRGEKGACAQGKAGERMIGRAVKGIDRLDIEGLGDGVDGLLGPLIQRQAGIAPSCSVKDWPNR